MAIDGPSGAGKSTLARAAGKKLNLLYVDTGDTPEEWLDGFGTFSIYQVLPQLIELWGLNVKTDVEAKKNFAQLTAR